MQAAFYEVIHMSFVKNDNQQLTVLDSTFNLTEREKRMLEKSWAKTFADKVFPAIDENIFSVLYSKKASRSNTPVNVIVGALSVESIQPVGSMFEQLSWLTYDTVIMTLRDKTGQTNDDLIARHANLE